VADEMDLTLAARIAEISSEAPDLERLSRPLLELLVELTGFESTWVSAVHWEAFEQEIQFAHNTGPLDIPEGAVVDWSDTLCRRALLEGRSTTSDVPATWPDSDAARAVGIVSYISVPIAGPERAPVGTLCAASARSLSVGADTQRVMELFARLLADQVDRERRTQEERERIAAIALHARTNALAVASSEHKLKTPITVIRGATDALLHVDMPEAEQRGLLEAVARQAAALEEGIHELLRHQQPTIAAPPLALSRIQLEPALLRIVGDIRLIAGDRTISLQCTDRLECTVNPAALTHALEHLLDNALKYTPAGTPIEVAATDDGEVAVITVTDHGPGLPSDDLFDGFARGTDANVPGTGLGLYIVRSLVESMHGTVTAQAGPDGGAQFVVRLPDGAARIIG
jgi:signal transduction histidine kinase